MVWVAVSCPSILCLMGTSGLPNHSGGSCAPPPMVQTPYPEGGAMHQHDKAPIHTARLVTIKVEHFPWPANIFEALFTILEEKI